MKTSIMILKLSCASFSYVNISYVLAEYKLAASYKAEEWSRATFPILVPPLELLHCITLFPKIAALVATLQEL